MISRTSVSSITIHDEDDTTCLNVGIALANRVDGKLKMMASCSFSCENTSEGRKLSPYDDRSPDRSQSGRRATS